MTRAEIEREMRAAKNACPSGHGDNDPCEWCGGVNAAISVAESLLREQRDWRFISPTLHAARPAAAPSRG